MRGNSDLLNNAFKAVMDGGEWGHALADITQCYWHTSDKSVSKFLVDIVVDEARPRDLRLAAYCSLFEVSGKDVWALPPVNEFRIPDDFDWGFLKAADGTP